MNYVNLEASDRKCKITKIALFAIITIIIISIISIYVNNHSDNKIIRRKLDIIQGDITNLYNYTETMSDFLVGDYSDTKIILDIKKEFNDFKEISLKGQEDIKKEFNDFKENSLKGQEDIKKEFDDFKEISLKGQEDIKKEFDDFKEISLKGQEDIKKLMIRKTALEFLNKIGFNQNNWFAIRSGDYYKYYNTNTKCFQIKSISIDFNEIFEKLLKIDYDKFIVSFAYFSDNYEDNFKAHPIYKLINETLEFDYELLTNIPCDYFDECFRTNNGGFYYKLAFINKIPYKPWCVFKPFIFVGRDDQLAKIYDEYEYISRIIRFTSIAPQRFL